MFDPRIVSGLQRMSPQEAAAVEQLVHATVGMRDDATREERAAATTLGATIAETVRELGYDDPERARQMINKTESGKAMLEQIGDAAVDEMRRRDVYKLARQFLLSEEPGQALLMRDLITGELLSAFSNLLETFEENNWGVGQLVRAIADAVRESMAQLHDPPRTHRTTWSTAAGY